MTGHQRPTKEIIAPIITLDQTITIVGTHTMDHDDQDTGQTAIGPKNQIRADQYGNSVEVAACRKVKELRM
jgi:hypothetical protein